MQVRPHTLMRLGGLLQRKAAVDRANDLARGNGFPQVGPHAADDRGDFLTAARAEGDADIVETPEGMEVEIEFGLDPTEAADIDDAPAHAGCLHALIEPRARDHVDHEVDATSAG